jgi:hypothetical protein
MHRQSFAWTLSFMLSDVMCDALIVERSKHEPPESTGSLAATAYISRALGMILGSTLGTLVYNQVSTGRSHYSIIIDDVSQTTTQVTTQKGGRWRRQHQEYEIGCVIYGVCAQH